MEQLVITVNHGLYLLAFWISVIHLFFPFTNIPQASAGVLPLILDVVYIVVLD
jgi:hypothetical protein